MKGERAILMEMDLAKKREERNKLLRFNEMSAVEAMKAQQIEMKQKIKEMQGGGDKEKVSNQTTAEATSARPMRAIDAILARAK